MGVKKKFVASSIVFASQATSHSHDRFSASFLSIFQPPASQPLDFPSYLLFVERNLVSSFWLWPKVWHGEFCVEIGAKVIHPADGEEYVHAKLEYLEIWTCHGD